MTKNNPAHPEDLVATAVYEFDMRDGQRFRRIFVSLASHSKRGLGLIVQELERDASDVLFWKEIRCIKLIAIG